MIHRATALILFSAFVVALPVVSQDDELAILPPMPNLDLGDPERKLSWRERREINKEARLQATRQAEYTRQPEDRGYATVRERIERDLATPPRRPQEAQQITVENGISSSDDAVTASGGRLKPFGEEESYWGPLPPPTPEEQLVVLPPMPDLRTPDQVTRRERTRNLLVARKEARAAELKAKREAEEAARRATVSAPVADPSSALVQVQSQRGSGGGMGNIEAPETADRGTLKPFDAGSVYYQGGREVYRGSDGEPTARQWWDAGRSEPGGGDGPRFKWVNPFSRGDRVQPVSFERPSDGAFGSSPSSAGAPLPANDPVLTSNLRGIRVVPTTEQVRKSGVGGISGVQVSGVDLPPKVRVAMERRLGSTLTLSSLNELVRDSVIAYRRSDLPVVDVLVPEQEINGGVLQLVVIEGRLGDVIVEGVDNQEEGRTLVRNIRSERGEVIRESALLEDLSWINKHPTRRVDLVYQPGQEYGETDVILRTQDYKEFSAYVAYENSGTDVLGVNRAIIGASWTGPLFLGTDSILSYQFSTNFDSPDANSWGHSGVFATYLPWRHQITLLGAFAHTEANFLANNGNFLTGGDNKQLSGRYGIPLPNIGRFTHELELGMDFKSSNSALNFNQIQVFDTTSEIVQYSLGYNILARDRTGTWRADLELVSSPGDNTNKNTDAIFQTQRNNASANYTYFRATVERDQQLVNGWTMGARATAQSSNANLLASETLGAGGFDSVRGFEQRVARGDDGVVGTVELRTPTVYPSRLSGFQNLQDAASGLIFYDFAWLSSETEFFGEQNRELGSIGLGIRYQLERNFTLRVDYGFQLQEEGFDDGTNSRWHIGARATF